MGPCNFRWEHLMLTFIWVTSRLFARGVKYTDNLEPLVLEGSGSENFGPRMWEKRLVVSGRKLISAPFFHSENCAKDIYTGMCCKLHCGPLERSRPNQYVPPRDWNKKLWGRVSQELHDLPPEKMLALDSDPTNVHVCKVSFLQSEILNSVFAFFSQNQATCRRWREQRRLAIWPPSNGNWRR